ncbi:Tetratricopeptide repeat protein [Trichostrongylus colubriformis]|uniref:Tetratricopeptide repeat protein n=1 Tax=Trichostrongylus colubriformis TaxID=6319 RepID=A0AAN8EYB5_TRICO
MLLRAKLMKTVDSTERAALQKRSSQLAIEAVALDPESGPAHSCLGNSLFLEFFNTGQTNEGLLRQACNEYRLALQCDKEYRNADLHLNAGAAFRYEENYAEALTHLRLAVKYDPSDVIGSHGRLSAFTQFLSNVASGIQTAGGLRAKRIVEFKMSLPNSSDMNPFADHRLVTNFKDLGKGPNNGVAVVGKIISTVSHEEIVPITSIMMDADGECVAVSVYNCAPSLTFFIGDTVAVADPHVVEVESLDLPDSPDTSFRSVRVPNPSKIARNGSLPKATQLAPSHLKISAL